MIKPSYPVLNSPIWLFTKSNLEQKGRKQFYCQFDFICSAPTLLSKPHSQIRLCLLWKTAVRKSKTFLPIIRIQSSAWGLQHGEVSVLDLKLHFYLLVTNFNLQTFVLLTHLFHCLLNPLCPPAVITVGPVSMETTGIDVNVLQGFPAQTAGSVSADLWPLDLLLHFSFPSIWPWLSASLLFSDPTFLPKIFVSSESKSKLINKLIDFYIFKHSSFKCSKHLKSSLDPFPSFLYH